MNMTALFDDFMRYVDAMDDEAVKRSIADAVAHTSDSYILDGNFDAEETKDESITQSIHVAGKANTAFSFCSVFPKHLETSFNLSTWGGDAA